MLKIWSKLFLAECEVIKFSKNLNIYPIFKNGRSSLMIFARRNNLSILKNKEISNLKEVTVFIREPIERFISGIHSFFYLHDLKLNNENLKKINNYKIINQHFMPQAFWLFHLFKYYKQDVILKPVEEVFDLIPIREGPWHLNPKPWTPLTENEKNKIKKIDIEKFTDIDYKVVKKYLNKKTNLSVIVKEIKNVLSSS